MLTEIRDRSSGAFAWVIAALIIIPMAFWGVQEYASTEANPAVAEIGDKKITQSEFRNSLQNEQQRARAQMGDNVNEEFLASDLFKQGVLQRMINRALIEQVAEQQNYRVSNQQLVAEIKNNDLFKIDGQFNQEAYERFLISSQYAKRQFEDGLRQDLALQQVTSGYEESALVLPSEVRMLLEAQVERRTIDLATLRKQSQLEGLTVTEQEIADYYAGNEASFMEPEKMSVQYIEVSAEDLMADVEVDEQVLRDIYEQNAEAYVSAARREVRHILLTTDGNEEEQLEKANQLRQQLQAGADFAELAAQHSDDPGSANNGGSLGYIDPGQMVPEFEEAAFSLEQGVISEPVKSPFGYHLIEVTDLQLPEQQSFEDVRFELLQAERAQQGQERYLELLDRLRDLAFEQPDNLDAAADQLNLPLQTSGLFSRQQGEGIAALPLVRNLAFSDTVFIEGLNSEPLEVAEGQSFVLRKLDVQPAAPKALAEVSDQIRQRLLDEKAAAAAAARGEELLAMAKQNWGALAGQGVEQSEHTVSMVEPAVGVPPQVLQHVTRMRLNDGAPSVDQVVDRNGDVHLVRLREITPGNVGAASEQIKQATRQVLAQRNGGTLLATYVEKLRDEHAAEVDASLL